MNFKKTDKDKGTLTQEQTIFKIDLVHEKETIEARLVEINSMIDALK